MSQTLNTPIVGEYYVSRSPNVADNLLINLYPEINKSGGKEQTYLRRVPGKRLVAQVGFGPIRGLIVLKGVLYVVSGSEFFSVNLTTYGITKIGDVSLGLERVSLADNGNQIFIACNGPSYIYNSTTNSFTQITDPDFEGAGSVVYMDGYFVFNQPDSQTMWVTEIFDGTVINPLDFASAEGSPDNIVGLVADHRELWVFGESSIEVWYDAGLADFPFQRVQGAVTETGCVSKDTIVKLDNTLFWLGKDLLGGGIVYRAEGYSAKRVSTHSIETLIGSSDLSSAFAFSYQRNGHSFYHLTVPSKDLTFCYDVSTDAWHQRALFQDGVFKSDISNCIYPYNGVHYVGDRFDANLYILDDDTYFDNSLPIKWLRRWRAFPTGQSPEVRTIHNYLLLDCETGFDIPTHDPPQIMLRWSDDSGHTWSNEHWLSMGLVGEKGNRVIWRRLGSTVGNRSRLYEVSGISPVPIYINGALLDVEMLNA